MFEPPVAGNPKPSGDVTMEPRPLAPGTGRDPFPQDKMQGGGEGEGESRQLHKELLYSCINV